MEESKRERALKMKDHMDRSLSYTQTAVGSTDSTLREKFYRAALDEQTSALQIAVALLVDLLGITLP